MELVAILQNLYNFEINCGISSFWDGGYDVWIGDEMNGIKEETQFNVTELDKAAEWLFNTACRLYPEYAKKYSV